ncbi:MAG: hypothetical protein GY713_08555 [Actinomycetia bacterium]|nr:hypothetical protein [Actinomycetes bacterium]
MTEAQIAALDEPENWADVFDDRTRAVLELADAMCSESQDIGTELNHRLRGHFREMELAELILVVGQANLNNRAGNAAKQLLGDPR